MQIGNAKKHTIILNNKDGVYLKTPALRNIPVMLFLSFWLCGWLIGGLNAIVSLLFSGHNLFGKLFMIFWLGGWLFGVIIVTTTLLVLLSPGEEILISKTELVRDTRIPVIGKTYRYRTDQISNLRVAEISGRYQRPFPVERKCMIEFDFQRATQGFGVGMDPADARYVVTELLKLRPDLA